MVYAAEKLEKATDQLVYSTLCAADPGGRAFWVVGLPPLACLGCGFE